jgi:hypothetical protein
MEQPVWKLHPRYWIAYSLVFAIELIGSTARSAVPSIGQLLPGISIEKAIEVDPVQVEAIAKKLDEPPS